MNVLFITPEMAPHSGNSSSRGSSDGRGGSDGGTTGGAAEGGVSEIAEVSSALPKALRGLDHRVTVLSPLYRQIDPAALSLARRLTTLNVEVADREFRCELYAGRTSAGVHLMFIGNDELFLPVASLCDGEPSGSSQSLGRQVFAHAVAQLLGSPEADFDAVHAFGYEGVACFGAAALPGNVTLVGTLFDVPGAASTDAETHRLFQAGLARAHHRTAATRGLASSINHSVEPTSNVEVVPSGVDGSIWNPMTDACLAARFDPVDQQGKAHCKAALQREVGLPVRSEVPLLGAIASGGRSQSRENGAAAHDRLANLAPQILRNDMQWVVLQEHAAGASAWRDLAERWPDRIQVRSGTDASFYHRLLGGADLMLCVPLGATPAPASSAFRQRAERYGCVPIVPRGGGVGEGVVDCDAQLESGTGFVAHTVDDDGEELLAVVRRALGSFAMPEAFAQLRARAMNIDNSWERSARLYDRLYRGAAPTVDEQIREQSPSAAAPS